MKYENKIVSCPMFKTCHYQAIPLPYTHHFILKCPVHGIAGVFTLYPKLYKTFCIKIEGVKYYFYEDYENILPMFN